MQELIKKIMENAEISAGQTMKALETIKEFVKEQYPMMAGAVDKLFESKSDEGEAPIMHADADDYL